MFHRISAKEAIIHARQPGAVLLDVRTPAEIATSGTAKGAVCIPTAEVLRRIKANSDEHARRVADAEHVIVFCAVGARAAAVAEHLAAMGNKRVEVFDAFRDWVAEGGPLDAS